MQLRRLLYMSCLLLVGTTACQDELFLPLVEEKEVPVVQGNEILLPREYTQYTLTTEKLKGLEGCHIHAKEGFVFLSDSIVRNAGQHRSLFLLSASGKQLEPDTG